MKTNQEILDKFGQILVKHVFDNNYRFVLGDKEGLANTKGYENLFRDMNEIEKKELEYLTKERLKNALFDFLRIFEENPSFRLIYSENGEEKELLQISESLMGEPVVKNGWIERFSEYYN